MKYDKVDRKWLERYFDVLSKLRRTVQEFRKDRQCAKEVFVRRTLDKWLRSKSFAVIEETPTGLYKETSGWVTSDSQQYCIRTKNYVHVCIACYACGWGDDIKFYIETPYMIKGTIMVQKTLSYNDFLDLEYKEIPNEEYVSVMTLFKDDSKND